MVKKLLIIKIAVVMLLLSGTAFLPSQPVEQQPNSVSVEQSSVAVALQFEEDYYLDFKFKNGVSDFFYAVFTDSELKNFFYRPGLPFSASINSKFTLNFSPYSLALGYLGEVSSEVDCTFVNGYTSLNDAYIGEYWSSKIQLYDFTIEIDKDLYILLNNSDDIERIKITNNSLRLVGSSYSQNCEGNLATLRTVAEFGLTLSLRSTDIPVTNPTQRQTLKYKGENVLCFNDSLIYTSGKGQLRDKDGFPIMDSQGSPVFDFRNAFELGGHELTANETGLLDSDTNTLIIKKTLEGKYYLVDNNGKVVRGGFKSISLKALNDDNFLSSFAWGIANGENGSLTVIEERSLTSLNLIVVNRYTINGNKITDLNTYLTRFIINSAVAIVSAVISPIFATMYVFTSVLEIIVEIKDPDLPADEIVYGGELNVVDVNGRKLFMSDYADELQVVDSDGMPVMDSNASAVFCDFETRIFYDNEGNFLSVQNNVLIDVNGQAVFGAPYIKGLQEYKDFSVPLSVAALVNSDGHRVLCVVTLNLESLGWDMALIVGGGWISFPFVAANIGGNIKLYDVLFRQIDKNGVLISEGGKEKKSASEIIKEKLDELFDFGAVFNNVYLDWIFNNLFLIALVIVVIIFVPVLIPLLSFVAQGVFAVVKFILTMPVKLAETVMSLFSSNSQSNNRSSQSNNRKR